MIEKGKSVGYKGGCPRGNQQPTMNRAGETNIAVSHE